MHLAVLTLNSLRRFADHHRRRAARLGWVFVSLLFAFYLAVIVVALTHQPPTD